MSVFQGARVVSKHDNPLHALETESHVGELEGFQTISRDYMGFTVAVILLALNGSVLTTSIRVTSSIPAKTERNQEIIQCYLAGERALDLAQEFGISVRRVNKLIVRQRKHKLHSSWL